MHVIIIFVVWLTIIIVYWLLRNSITLAQVKHVIMNQSGANPPLSISPTFVVWIQRLAYHHVKDAPAVRFNLNAGMDHILLFCYSFILLFCYCYYLSWVLISSWGKIFTGKLCPSLGIMFQQLEVQWCPPAWDQTILFLTTNIVLHFTVPSFTLNLFQCALAEVTFECFMHCPRWNILH